MIQIRHFIGGYDKNLSYLIWCHKSKKTAIVDPAVKIEPIINFINKNNLKLEKILITHSHSDHIQYLKDILLRYNYKLEIYISEKTKINDFKLSNHISNNQIIDLGFEQIQCLYTPGHYYDSTCFWSIKNNIIFTGDTMFIGRTGRTIHKGSNINDLYDSIYNTLLKLPLETMIFSGHDYGKTKFDTIGNNIKNSNFFSCKNFEEFLLVMNNYEKSRKK